MEKFWKWLLKADAKGLFVASLVLLAGVAAWWGVALARAPGEDAPKSQQAKDAAAPPELAAFKPIGVIGFVSNQFAPETLIVPVNPFHPPFEEIVKTLARHSENGVITILDKEGKPRAVHFENGVLVDANGVPVANPFQRSLTPRRPGQSQSDQSQAGRQGHPQQGLWPHRQLPQRQEQQAPQPPPKPRLTFNGVMQRPDGTFASYVSIVTGDKRTTRFVKVGDKIGNATVTASGRDGVELTFDEGARTTLRIGDEPVTLDNR